MFLTNLHSWLNRHSTTAKRKRRTVKRSAKSSLRPQLEALEERDVPAYVFVDFGDRFPMVGGNPVLTTTVGAIRDVAPAQGRDRVIQGPQLHGDGLNPLLPYNYPDGTSVALTSFNDSPATRATLIANATRAFEAVNVTVVELTAIAQGLPDGRLVKGAANLDDVAATLRGNNTTTNDVYVIVAQPAIGPRNDNPFNFGVNGYGGISPTGTVFGETTDLQGASNSHDDLVLNFRNDANTIVHEAGHALGLQHAVTNKAPGGTAIDNLLPKSEVMSYLSTESAFFYSRYPMVRGDDNTPASGKTPFNNYDLEARRGLRTPFDQLRDDQNVGENPDLHYISGTGANDVIRVTKGAGNTANVSVSAYADKRYTTPILVPGSTPPFTYNYTVNLDRRLLIQAGLGDDKIILAGDLDVPVSVEAGDGTDKDSIVVDDGAARASFRYTVTNTTLTRNTGFALTYSNAEDLELITGPNAAASVTTVNVESTAAATPLSIRRGGDLEVNVGKAGSAQGVRGNVILISTGVGKVALVVNNYAEYGGTVTLTRRSLSGVAGGSARIVYGPTDLSALTVSTGGIGNFGNEITVESTPFAPVTLYTGISRDVVIVHATNGPLTVNGQSGADEVVVGLLGSVQGIGGPLTITNADSYSEVFVDDSADTLYPRTVILYHSNTGRFTVLSGLSPGGDISLGRDDLKSLTISAGPLGNTFIIHDTLPALYVDGGHLRATLTSINTGAGADTVTIDGTTGRLALDVQGASQGRNTVTVGSAMVDLTGINGPISVSGSANVMNDLAIRDGASTMSRDYVMGRNFVQRTDKARIDFQNLNTLTLQAGALALTDRITVQDTMPPLGANSSTTIAKSGGDDVIDVLRTTGALVINAGGSSVINVGDALNSLANIQGRISVVPSGAGNAISLSLNDQAATTPQQLDVAPAVLATSFRRSGAAEIQVLVSPLASFEWYSPLVGGSTVNVKGGVPAQTVLNLAVSSDTVTLGRSSAPNLGGTLANIKGPVTVSSYSPDDAVTLVLDDSGNANQTPKNATLTPAEDNASYDRIEDFAPNTLYWFLGSNASVSLLGGAADESFRLRGTNFAPAISIDGGGGFNSLDYSPLASGVVVNLPMHTATGLAGGIANIQNVIGSAGNDILVGDGGNVLTGGLGRDLLIAGALAGILNGGEDEDILIGGTLNDSSQANLDAIMAEWLRTDLDYGARVANLRADLLADGKATSNGGGNTLDGGDGLDLFFVSLGDMYLPEPGEQFFPAL